MTAVYVILVLWLYHGGINAASLSQPTSYVYSHMGWFAYVATQQDGMHTMLMEAVNQQININNPHKNKLMILSQLYYIPASFLSLLNSVLTMRVFYN